MQFMLLAFLPLFGDVFGTGDWRFQWELTEMPLGRFERSDWADV
jgi:hypothetical protein